MHPHSPSPSSTSPKPFYPSTHNQSNSSHSKWSPYLPTSVNSVTGVVPLSPLLLHCNKLAARNLGNNPVGSSLSSQTPPYPCSDDDIHGMPCLISNTSSDNSDGPRLRCRRPVRVATDPIQQGDTTSSETFPPVQCLSPPAVQTPQAPSPPPPYHPLPSTTLPLLLACGAPCQPPSSHHTLELPTVNYLSSQHYSPLATPLPSSSPPLVLLTVPARCHHNPHVDSGATAPRANHLSNPAGITGSRHRRNATRVIAPRSVAHRSPFTLLPLHRFSSRAHSSRPVVAQPVSSPRLHTPSTITHPDGPSTTSATNLQVCSPRLPLLDASDSRLPSGLQHSRTTTPATITAPMFSHPGPGPVPCYHHRPLPLSQPSSCCRNGFYDGSSSSDDDDEVPSLRSQRRSLAAAARVSVHPPSPLLQNHYLSAPATPPPPPPFIFASAPSTPQSEP